MSVVEDLPQEGVRAPVDITWDSWLQGVNTPNLSLGPSLSLSLSQIGWLVTHHSLLAIFYCLPACACVRPAYFIVCLSICLSMCL
mgnify:CR=1 FL=1